MVLSESGGLYDRAGSVEMHHGSWTVLWISGGMDAVGKAIGLPQDKQKMAVGKALIRYFCVPCKPTRTNGGRTWNLPKHDED